MLLGKRDFQSTQPCTQVEEKAEVDRNINDAKNYEIVIHNGEEFNCYLLCANAAKNNNKFYIIQLLKHKLGH